MCERLISEGDLKQKKTKLGLYCYVVKEMIIKKISPSFLL